MARSNNVTVFEQSFTEAEKAQIKANLGIEDNNTFYATYGTTTYEEINTALTAGKKVWLQISQAFGNSIVISYSSTNSGGITFSGCDAYRKYVCNVSPTNVWTNEVLPFSKSVTNATLHTSYSVVGSKVLYTLPTATYDRYIDLNLSGCIQANGTTAGSSNAYVVNVNITRNGLQDTTLERNIYIDKVSSDGGVSNENFNLIWKVKVPANEAFLVNTVGANYGTGLNSVNLINVRQSMSEEMV